MLNQICVIMIKVRDLKSAVNFYTEVLDFKVSKHYGDKIVSLVHNDVPVVLEESADKKWAPIYCLEYFQRISKVILAE